MLAWVLVGFAIASIIPRATWSDLPMLGIGLYAMFVALRLLRRLRAGWDRLATALCGMLLCIRAVVGPNGIHVMYMSGHEIYGLLQQIRDGRARWSELQATALWQGGLSATMVVAALLLLSPVLAALRPVTKPVTRQWLVVTLLAFVMALALRELAVIFAQVVMLSVDWRSLDLRWATVPYKVTSGFLAISCLGAALILFRVSGEVTSQFAGCPVCGYPRRGLASNAACPECGAVA
jgi:hypothetical protein